MVTNDMFETGSRPLAIGSDGKLPQMHGRALQPDEAVAVVRRSVTFVHFATGGAPACGHI